ncbi:MAG: hypothetical protein V4568_04605 [Pseudomonadota bacterium]
MHHAEIPQIAFATGGKTSKPDEESPALVEALATLDIRAAIIPWDEPIDWAQIPLVVIRTPWDYFTRLSEFLKWTHDVDRVTRLENPSSVIQWNSSKRYLLDLKLQGVPIVPTKLISAEDYSKGFDLHGSFDSEELIVKPAVSAGAIGVLRAKRNDPALIRHIEELITNGDVLVQPLVPSIATSGEVSIIFFGGVVSHAIRKQPALGDYRVQDDYGGTIHDHQPTQRELEVAHLALRAAPAPCAYARVDLVATDVGPAIMELELIEPELFLRVSPTAADLYATQLKALLRTLSH